MVDETAMPQAFDTRPMPCKSGMVSDEPSWG